MDIYYGNAAAVWYEGYQVNSRDCHDFKIILNAQNPEFRWNYEGNSTPECHVLYVYKIKCSKETEISEVKYEVEKKDVTLGTFANCKPHIKCMRCLLKFQEDVTLCLSGSGPIIIFACEVKKPKPKEGFWTSVKDLIGQYTWINDSSVNREKRD